jgi:hypothetical protein
MLTSGEAVRLASAEVCRESLRLRQRFLTPMLLA